MKLYLGCAGCWGPRATLLHTRTERCYEGEETKPDGKVRRRRFVTTVARSESLLFHWSYCGTFKCPDRIVRTR